jgi:hypothetical protein
MKRPYILMIFLAAMIILCGCSQKPPAPAADSGKSATIAVNTPTGSVEVSAHAGVTEAEAGVPFYPNAKPAEGGGGSFSAKSTQPGQSGSVVAVDLTTTDPVESVIQFYTKELGKPNFDMATSDGHSATWNTESMDKKSTTYVTVVYENKKPGIVTIAILKTGTH